MAVVVAAKHLQLRETVAVKLLHPHVLANPRSVERFLREARVTMRLRGEHVARVYDVGALEDGTPFVVMESLEGVDLGGLLRQRRRLPVREAVDYVLQACEAVVEAHALGVVHRDLKPANLFLTKRIDGSPCVKVLDFGVSKTLVQTPEDEDSEIQDEMCHTLGANRPLEETAPPSGPVGCAQDLGSLGLNERWWEDRAFETITFERARLPATAAAEGMTMTHAFLGSPKYVAPEQLRCARDVDARADVWALGVILHELINGAPPFHGSTLDEISEAILHGDPAPFVVRDAAGLQTLLRRCLAKDREQRFPSVHALATALAHLASSEGRLSADRIVRMHSGRTSAHRPWGAGGFVAWRRDPGDRSARARWSWVGIAVVAGATASLIGARRVPASTAVVVHDDPGHAPVQPAPMPYAEAAVFPTGAFASEPATEGFARSIAPSGPAPSFVSASARPSPARDATLPPRAGVARRTATATVDPLGIPGGSLFDTRR
jgi:serine/threonine-protein kinase